MTVEQHLPADGYMYGQFVSLGDLLASMKQCFDRNVAYDARHGQESWRIIAGIALRVGNRSLRNSVVVLGESTAALDYQYRLWAKQPGIVPVQYVYGHDYGQEFCSPWYPLFEGHYSVAADLLNNTTFNEGMSVVIKRYVEGGMIF